jgi:IS5 family transposase
VLWAGVASAGGAILPEGRETRRPPIGLSIMLRVHFLQQWFNLRDHGAKDALNESSHSGRRTGSRRASERGQC